MSPKMEPADGRGGTEDPGRGFELKAYGRNPGAFSIGLSPIPETRWFEGEDADPAPRKRALLASARADVWGEAPGSRPGQVEVLRLVSAWRDRQALEDWDAPLLQAASLVEDDLCLMERRDGGWTLTAASLCSGSFFTPAESVGKALADLHAPVPGFNQGLLFRVARIFDHLAQEDILERRNWSVVNAPDLSLPRAAPVRQRVKDISPSEAGRALFVRSERQTIRRLRETGGILFTIRIWREALGAVLSDPQRRAAFASAWEAAMSDPEGGVRRYKGLDLYAPLITPLLA
jgi:hypothetical protein